MRATKPKIECLFVALIVLMLAVGMTLVADSKSMKVSEAPLGSTGATDSGAQPLVISAFSTLEEMTAYDAVLAKPEPQVIPFQQRPALQGVGPAGAAPRAPIEAAPPMPGQGPSPDAPPLVTNFIGVLDDLTYIPPDTMGAVGPNHIVEFLNSGFTVFNRAGAVVSPQITLQAFWAALGTLAGQPASRPFDPKVIYDQHSSRWIVVSDGNPNGRDGTNNSWVLVGISQSSDPTLGWNLYAIDPDADNNEWFIR